MVAQCSTDDRPPANPANSSYRATTATNSGLNCYRLGRSAAVWDGLWHQYRVYFKVSSARGVPDGAARFYLDGRLIKSFATVVIDATDIYGVALGRNLNQGPEEPMSVWWGRIRIWERTPGW